MVCWLFLFLKSYSVFFFFFFCYYNKHKIGCGGFSKKQKSHFEAKNIRKKYVSSYDGKIFNYANKL